MAKPIAWHIDDLLAATGGRLYAGAPDAVFEGIGIDSRRIEPGHLFLALKGTAHDGHDFIPDVLSIGGSGFIVEEPHLSRPAVADLVSRGLVCIAVPDSVRALGDLARFQRQRARAAVAAVTGSNGKTSTRAFMTSVLRRRFNTLSTEGNFNNEIGLPLTLLKLSGEHQWAAVELGMNHFGEIRNLAGICLPDIGVITNVGPAHLEGVGSIEGVARAKAELLPEIQPRGKAVLNADDPHIRAIADQATTEIIWYGLSETAQVRGRNLRAKNHGMEFTLELPSRPVGIFINTPGHFMVSNALAAAAVGLAAGLSAEEIKDGLETFNGVAGRMRILTTGNDIHLIDDTYNANPASMQGAMDTLAAMKGNNRAFLVTGDMFELGDQAETLHRELGATAGRSDLAGFCVTGEWAPVVVRAAQDADLDENAIFTGTHEHILDYLKTRLRPGDWILVKGSRAMKMERIIQGLKTWGER